MRRLATVLTTIALGSALAVCVPEAASAATGEFGNECVASLVASGTIVLTGGAISNPIPVAAPSSGVITKLRFSAPTIPSEPTVVKVMRATGTPNEYTVLRQTGSLSVTTGITTFPVSMPVAAGDLLGVYGSLGSLACSTPNAGDTVALVAGDSAPGTTAVYSPTSTIAIPLVATVEPDADSDGFGDLTQDLCPGSATLHTACPTVRLDSYATGPGIKVLVATDLQAAVSVTGTVKVNGKTIKLTGGTKSVAAATLVLFKVKLPKALKSALAKLPPSKRITVSLTASANNVVGGPTTDVSKVKLRGTRS
jgi:hypothetical protein